MPLDDVKAALRRQLAARSVPAESPLTPAASPANPDLGGAPELSPEPLRALRTKWMLDAQGQASKSFGKSMAGVVDLQTRDPENPNLPNLREDVLGAMPDLLPPVTPGQAAALSRERARRGLPDPGLDSTPARIRAAIERGAAKIDPNEGVRGLATRLNAGVSSAFEYPLKLVSSLLRPFDSGPPAAAKAAIEGKDPVTAGLASMDPGGRFNERGAETGAWTNQPTNWADVAQAALRRWGTEKTVGVVGQSSDPERVGAKVTEPELFGIGRAGWAGVGTVGDIGLSPSTYLTAGAGTGKGIRLAGQTVIPDKAVTAIARAPGSFLERGAEALASRMALDPRVSMQAAHKVGAVGEALGRVGPAQVLSAAPGVIGALPLGGGKTLGELAGEAFDRYYRINQIKDPALRTALLRLAQLRESGTHTQTAKWTDEVANLFKGVPLEEQRVIRDMVENPGAFDWNVERSGPVPGTDALATRRAVEPRAPGAGGLGPVESVPKEPTEVFAGRGRGETTGPNYMPGQPAAPTAVPGTPDAARYGPIPEHLSGQVPTVTAEQAELAGRTENILRDVREALVRRGRIRGRENYFPRERTKESLIQQAGDEARTEKLGRGVDPRLDWRAGFQEGRKEHTWINDLIDRTNEQIAREAEAKGMSPNLIPRVEDTTSAINEFWRRLPDRVREQLRGKAAEPERFLDRPAETLERYLARATSSVNDFDAMQALRGLKSEGRPVARPFAREGANGRVYESFQVPAGGRYDIPVSGPGVMVDPTPAPPGAPQLPRGRVNDGRYREGIVGPPRRPVAGELPGEVPPGGAAAFQGVSPLEPGMSTVERPIYGHVYPTNKAWREAFPNVSLPKDIAAWVDAFGEPYWANKGFAGLIDQFVVRPLHKAQLPWKVAATSGAGPRFALRNYMSQQIMNLQAYGPATFTPRIQQESHLLGLPDAVFAESPGLRNRIITDATGRQWTAEELREAAKQSGLWRTMPEAETWSAVGGPFSDVWSGPARSERVAGWNDTGSKASAVLGAGERALQRLTRAIGPGNPISKDFAPTKHLFHPMAEYGERQGRMAALIMELDQGKELMQAGQDASRVHVNYQSFSPAFEKYGTLAYPFAKFAVGITPNEAKWALQYPGRTMFTEHLLRGGESMVPDEERRRFEAEPKSSLIRQNAGRLVGFPGLDGPLKEPETATAKGPGRLPYVTLPPTADVFLNMFGVPARIAGANDRGSAFASEALEGALPAFKAPWEIATGRNVFTGEPIDTGQAVMAPRAIQALYETNPALAKMVFSASRVVDPKSGQSYLAVPQKWGLFWRYFPNVAAADLAAGLLGVKRPYDDQTALALRLLGVTQIIHDPLQTATQEAFENKKQAPVLQRRVEGFMPPR